MKKPAKAERVHMARVASLGCIVCWLHLGVHSKAEVHHIKVGNVGIGRRSSSYETLPLCDRHHRNGPPGIAFHAAPKTWEARYGTQTELLLQVERRLLEQAVSA